MMPIYNIGIMASAGGSQPTLLQAIQGAGLTANLKLCLDAGDLASYASGQTWADRSGNAVDFYRGTTSGSDATDPTFNGVAGNLSQNEYWSFDGGDYFTLVSGANPSWVQPFHKDGATFTAMFGFYPQNGANHYLMGDAGLPGFAVRCGGVSNGQPGLLVYNGASVLLTANATALMNIAAWNIFGVSVSENGGASAGIWSVNSTTETFNPSYASPSASSAGTTLKIAQSGGGNPLQPGERLAWVAVWDSALSAVQMQSIFAQTRGRFGI